MDFGGTYLFEAPRLAVWEALNDVAILKQTIPGCSQIGWTGDTTLDLTISVNLGVAHPTFAGQLELSDIHPAQSYTLSGHGKGGLMGLAHGSAQVTLKDAAEAGCLLSFSATGKGSGTLMRLGKAMIGKSAQAVIDGFFERFGTAMGVKVTPVANAERA